MDVARFRRLVAHVLGSPVLLAFAACGEAQTEMPEKAICIDPTADDRYARLTLAAGVDGIGFATRSTVFGGAGPATTTPRLLPVLGTPCKTAADRGACESKARDLLFDESSEAWAVNQSICAGFCPTTTVNDVAVVTSGDEVNVVSWASLVKAVAPVETREEAIALLILHNGLVECSGNNVRPEKDGWVFKYTRRSCGGETETFTKVTLAGDIVDAGQHVVEEPDDGCIEGRRPAGLRPTGSPWLSSVGACLAEIAHMEAAAVHAFAELASRLAALGAPAALLERTDEARRDEVRHAALTAALASSYGFEVERPIIDAHAAPSDDPLLALALENAIEGCVRESFGALVAAFQAAHASEPSIRRAFAGITRDEAAHAELAVAIDAWLMPRLDGAGRRAVAAATEAAWETLAAELAEPADDVRRIAGYPSLAEQRTLLRALRAVAVAVAVAA